MLQTADRGVPKIRSTLLGVPIIRTIEFWGLCSPYFGKLSDFPWHDGSSVEDGLNGIWTDAEMTVEAIVEQEC